MKKIILTGGGTAGHVTPNIALIDDLKKAKYDIYYIGSKNGMEKKLIEDQNIKYLGISSGKLRRYLDLKNFTDGFRVIKGCFEAIGTIKKISPNVVFSKGGFVSVPVAMACKVLKVPLVIHESDITPGLANKIAIPIAKAVCASFPETMENVNNKNKFMTGTPIRKEFLKGDRKKAKEICGFTDDKPVLLITGGSQGAVKINVVVRQTLNRLLKDFNIIHICGKDNIDEDFNSIKNYKQFEYLNDELFHMYALMDIAISRAGANSIYEFLSLKKPSLLIPLSKNASRGDQILNAQSFLKQGFSKVLEEENLNEDSFLEAVTSLYNQKDTYIQTMNKSTLSDGILEVLKVIEKFAK